MNINMYSKQPVSWEGDDDVVQKLARCLHRMGQESFKRRFEANGNRFKQQQDSLHFRNKSSYPYACDMIELPRHLRPCFTSKLRIHPVDWCMKKLGSVSLLHRKLVGGLGRPWSRSTIPMVASNRPYFCLLAASSSDNSRH
jgi:hypothetical protein